MNSRCLFTANALGRYATCFFIVFIGIAAFGQAGRGGISGTVTDPNGVVVAGAQVKSYVPGQHFSMVGSVRKERRRGIGLRLATVLCAVLCSVMLRERVGIAL